MSEKRSGCLSTGCGVVAVGVILFIAVLFISSLSPDDSGTDTTAERRSTPAPTTTVTPPPPVEPPTPTSPAATPSPEPEPQSTVDSTPELLEAIEKEPVSEEVLTRSYKWEYGDYEYTWNLSLPESIYECYKGLPRPPTEDYSVYVTHPWDDAYMDLLIAKIRAVASQDGLSEYQTIEMVAAFVQSLPYTDDSVTTPYDEYPRYPIETLVDAGGDCEDTSILLASLLKSMGYGVVLIELPTHCAVGVKGSQNVPGTYWEYEGSRYYYLETTGEGWSIGQLPEAYEGTGAHIYPMVPVPIITHDWELADKTYYIELKVKVANLGTAAAYDLFVYAGFDAGDGRGWSVKESDRFNLLPGQEVTATLGLLPPPPGVRTRLLVQIIMGGCKVDESYSVWVDT